MSGPQQHRAAPGSSPFLKVDQSVAIIGSGFGGLCMAIQLKRLGHQRFTIFEAAGELGGTWRDNTYPGAACDVPSHLYCYSFAPKRDWSRKFSPQPEILDYLHQVADRFRIRPHIKFNTPVTDLSWSDRSQQWTVNTATGDAYEFDVVVSAVGQLHRPHIPEVPGRDRFGGVQFHSARWNHAADLKGRDVVVIGSGASAIQFVPPVAATARRVTIMQRTPSYVAPRNDVEYSPSARAAYRTVPGLARLRRFRVWASLESKFILFQREGRIGKWFARKYAEGVAPIEAAGLSRAAIVPEYLPGCKRLLISDDWFPALLRPNVEVVTDGIDRIDAATVTAGGVEHPADVLIWGTGFETNEFLAPMHVTGAAGADLNDTWANGAEAYLGVCVAGFPNLFLLYGPNTNLGHNSIVFMIEQQVHFILRLLTQATRRGSTAVEVQPEAMSAFNRSLQGALDKTVWATSCTSWYKNAAGRITNNWSGLTTSYRRALRGSDLSEFRYLAPPPADPLAPPDSGTAQGVDDLQGAGA